MMNYSVTLILGSLVITLLFLIFFGSVIYQYFYWKRRKLIHVNAPPLLGHTAKVFLKRQAFTEAIREIYSKHPGAKYYGSFEMNLPCIVVKDPDIIRDIFIKNFDHFPDHRGFLTEEVDPVLGKNLFSLKGQKWKEARTAVSPTFTTLKMKFMVTLINECTQNFIKFFENNPKLALEFEASEIFRRYTCDVIASVAFGIQVDSLNNPDNDFFKIGMDVINFSTPSRIFKMIVAQVCPTLAKIVGINVFSGDAKPFFTQLVQNTVKERREKGLTRPDMIQVLLEAQDKENGIEVTVNDMISQAFIFFFAGFDATATLLSLACHELAANPKVQEKVRLEIENVFPEEDSAITYESIMKLKYLDMVLDETLRLHPAAVATDRICEKEFELPPPLPGHKPTKVERGTLISIPIYGFHHDPKYFPEPEKFCPERFEGDINPYVYLPFGGGPRKCIGNRFVLMEAKILLVHILKKFEIKLTEKSTNHIVFTSKKIQLIPEGGYWFSFQNIKKDK